MEDGYRKVFYLASCVSHASVLPHVCTYKGMQYFENRSSSIECASCFLGTNFIIKKKCSSRIYYMILNRSRELKVLDVRSCKTMSVLLHFINFLTIEDTFSNDDMPYKRTRELSNYLSSSNFC